jgi:hypothetical protein
VHNIANDGWKHGWITERGARVVAEVKLGKVAVQVLFFAMLIDAFHAAGATHKHCRQAGSGRNAREREVNARSPVVTTSGGRLARYAKEKPRPPDERG